MARWPSLSPTMIYPVLDWFIPQAIRDEGGTLQRARMFLISHLFGPFLGNTITLYLLLLQPKPDYALAILAISITAFWAFPFALRFTGLFTLLSVLSVQNLIFAILWGCYHYGGVSSPFLPWLLTVPLLAFFYLGPGPRPGPSNRPPHATPDAGGGAPPPFILPSTIPTAFPSGFGLPPGFPTAFPSWPPPQPSPAPTGSSGSI